jgi:hypothetical protein
MQNLTVHLGSPTPLSSRAGPRAPKCNPRLPAWHFRGWTPPLFSFPLCRADDRAAQARPCPLVLPSPLLSDSSSRAPKPPHRSLHPDRRLRPPAAHSPSWIPAEHRRRPPLPGELLPELPIPVFSCNFLTPCLSGAAGPHTRRHHPPEPPPRRRMPPPDAVCATSPSTRHSDVSLPSPPCPAPSP